MEPLNDQITETGEVVSGIEEEYLHSKDALYNWRAFRIAKRGEMHLFDAVTEGVDATVLLLASRNERKDKEVGGIEEVTFCMDGVTRIKTPPIGLMNGDVSKEGSLAGDVESKRGSVDVDVKMKDVK